MMFAHVEGQQPLSQVTVCSQTLLDDKLSAFLTTKLDKKFGY